MPASRARCRAEALQYDRLVSPRWFRVAYARNAFLRLLAESGLSLGELTPARGVRAMLAFTREYRPQHGVVDELVCAWGPVEGGFEFTITRRLQREGQPEAPLRLRFVVSKAEEPAASATVSTLAQILDTPGYRVLRHARVLGRELD